MKKEHFIIIVDDDTDDREILKDAFVSVTKEHQYIFFENGDMLLDYLYNHTENGLPSLILLDLNMPGKDGRETLKELKSDKRFSPIPTIVFTTSSSLRDKITSYDLGANCFITKPDTFNKLVELTKSINQLWLQ
ncbi:MAG TPA: response regulator [Flavisolibacter sp.]|nr:response regulator [Flavisolibacter sp.]